MKPSAVRSSGDDPTLTYWAPICCRNRSCSSEGLGEDCAQSLMPGATLCTIAEAFWIHAAVPRAPNAQRANSLRSSSLLVIEFFSVPDRVAVAGRSSEYIQYQIAGQH